MFEVFREYRFEAAHRLPRLPEGHKWGRLHGHSFVVQLPVRGTLDAEKGWLVPPSCRARTHGTMHWFEGRA